MGFFFSRSTTNERSCSFGTEQSVCDLWILMSFWPAILPALLQKWQHFSNLHAYVYILACGYLRVKPPNNGAMGKQRLRAVPSCAVSVGVPIQFLLNPRCLPGSHLVLLWRFSWYQGVVLGRRKWERPIVQVQLCWCLSGYVFCI